MKYWNKGKKKKKRNPPIATIYLCGIALSFDITHLCSISGSTHLIMIRCFHYWFWTNLNVKNLLPHHISYANFHWCSGVPIFLSHICLLPPSEHWCYDQLKNYFTLGKYISTALCMHISHYCFKVIVNKLLKILFIF